ncbi:hypothetical protein IAR50_006144 [Cryptococcus sp. DSM 104548]
MTSSILYPTLTTHPHPAPYAILVLSLPGIASAPPSLSNDELFHAILQRLEPWVGEEGEGGYVLVIMSDTAAEPQGATGAAGARKMPGVAWWVWKWKRIPRKYRKNLKRFYIVHPSLFTRSLLPLILPLLSPKSYPKLHPLPSLLALYHTHHVPLTGIDVSLGVLELEGKVLGDYSDVRRGAVRESREGKEAKGSEGGYFSSISSTLSSAVSYIGLSSPSPSPSSSNHKNIPKVVAEGYWHRTPTSLVNECKGKLPPLVVYLSGAILEWCTGVEGVFRRSSNSPYLHPLTALLALPLSAQPSLPWSSLAQKDCLLLPKLLCKLYASMAGGVIPREYYKDVRKVDKLDDIPTFLKLLPPAHALLLTALVSTLHALTAHEATTKMGALNLAIVLAPTLIGGGGGGGGSGGEGEGEEAEKERVADMAMCLERGRKLPGALLKAAGIAAGPGKGEGEEGDGGDGTVVSLLEMWISNYPAISGDTPVDKMSCAVSPTPTTVTTASPTTTETPKQALRGASSSSPFPSSLSSSSSASAPSPSSSVSASSASSSASTSKEQRRSSLSPSPSSRLSSSSPACAKSSSPPRAASASSLVRSASASIRRASLSLGRRRSRARGGSGSSSGAGGGEKVGGTLTLKEAEAESDEAKEDKDRGEAKEGKEKDKEKEKAGSGRERRWSGVRLGLGSRPMPSIAKVSSSSSSS